MPIRHHVKGQTNLNSTAAWSATRGGTGGETIPVTGDTVFLEDIEDNITTGLPSTANLERAVLSGAGGSIGAGVKWRVSNSANSEMEVSGEFSSLKIEAHGADDTGIDLLKLLDVRGCEVELIAGDISRIQAGRSGLGDLGANCVCDVFESAAMQWFVHANASAIATFQAGGEITCERKITAGDLLTGGRLLMTEKLGATAVTVGESDAGTGRLYVHSGATLLWNSRGFLNKVEALPGAILSGAVARWPIVFDSTAGALRRWVGARIFDDAQVAVEDDAGNPLVDVTEFVGMKPA